MNVITRGIRNTLRSPLRSGAIIIMLAISIGLILTMLVARSSVHAKIEEIKASTGTTITIAPAGMRGGIGGGDPLTTEHINGIRATAHVASVTSTLMDQLSTEETDLESSIELGDLGKRQMRFETQDDTRMPSMPDAAANKLSRIPITGSDNPSATITANELVNGMIIGGKSSEHVALVGKKLAEKNSLSVGSTFTAYGQTITIKGIYLTDNTFEDSGIIVPLQTLQTLTDQPDAISNVTVTADSADNVATLTEAIKSQLGDRADITDQQDQIKRTLQPLQNIAGLALGGVIGAAAASAVIILLTMVTIVRERRHEIGVLKAIGGTNVKAIGQFVIEALTLTVISSVVGLGLGVVASGPMTQSLVQTNTSDADQSQASNEKQAIIRGLQSAGSQLDNNLRNVTSTLTTQTFALSGGIILLIATIGSAIPAWAIARIRPAEVLRAD